MATVEGLLIRQSPDPYKNTHKPTPQRDFPLAGRRIHTMSPFFVF